MDYVFAPSLATLELAALGLVGIGATLVILAYAFVRNKTGQLWPDEIPADPEP